MLESYLFVVVQFFPGHKHLDYALRVEEYTLGKAANLVLNVDGCIAGEAGLVHGVCLSVVKLWHTELKTCGGWDGGPFPSHTLATNWAKPSQHLCVYVMHHFAPPPCTALFLDLLASSGCFTQKEMDDIISVGYLNGLFVLARSIGLIGHSLDQKRLQQPLYRHAWEDVL